MGAIYGVGVWLVGAVILMGLIVEGTFVLDLNWASLFDHVVWGVALGSLNPCWWRWSSDAGFPYLSFHYCMSDVLLWARTELSRLWPSATGWTDSKRTSRN